MQSLLLLACPVSMGLMMWFMLRGQKPRRSERPLESRTIETLRADQQRLQPELGWQEPNGAGASAQRLS